MRGGGSTDIAQTKNIHFSTLSRRRRVKQFTYEDKKNRPLQTVFFLQFQMEKFCICACMVESASMLGKNLNDIDVNL